MNTTSGPTPRIPITSIKNDSQMLDLDSGNNLSYVENYHQKYYYPKIVMARIRRRCAKVHQILKQSDLKSVRKPLGKSLETILPSYYDNDVAIANTWNFVDRTENSEYYRLRRTFSSEQFNKTSTTDFTFTYFERKLSDERRICDATWSNGTSSSDIFGSTEDCTSAESDDDDDDLDLYTNTNPLKRSSSLRRTYNRFERVRKKCVRFADALGLELHSVRDLDTSYSTPLVIPQSALDDLRPGLEELHKSEGTQYICMCFSLPGQDGDFLKRVLRDRVVLESCTVGARDLTATGTVCVANICHRKEVIVRYTVNGWMTCDDIISSYVQNPVSDAIDRFSFSIALPLGMRVGSQLMFAIRYAAIDLQQVFWDNNFGDDYRLECYAKAVPIRESDSTWMHFL